MAFYFKPSPGDGEKTTNPASSVTYTWRDKYNSWIIEPPEEVTAGTPNVISEIRPIPIEEFPTGTLWFNPLEEQLYIQTGSDWEPAAAAVGASGGSEVLVQDEQPSDQPTGTLWFDTNPNELTLYVFEGTDWVPAAPPVSVEGIEGSVTLLNEAVYELEHATINHGQDIADVKSTQYGMVTALAHLDAGQKSLEQDQQRQDGEIKSLEQEIEGIVPSYERGVYGFTSRLQDMAGSDGGFYAIVERFVSPEEMCNTLLTECQAAAGDDVVAKSQCSRDYETCIAAVDGEEGDAPIFSDQWHKAGWLWIDLWDKKNDLHTFRDAKAGKYIELTNSDGSGNMVALIEEDRIEIDPGISQIKINVLSWNGTPSGDARIKLFEISAADPTEYLKKTGGTMSGALTIDRPRDNSNRNSFIIRGRVNGEEKILLRDYQRKNDSDQSDYIEYFGANKASTRCLVTNGSLEIEISETKEYIDKQIQLYAQPKPTSFTWTLQDYVKNENVNKGFMAIKDEKFIYLSEETFEGVKLAKPENMPTGPNVFNSFDIPQFNNSTKANVATNMKLWMQQGSGAWRLIGWMTPYKYRFWYGGFVEIEFTNFEGKMPESADNGKRFGVSLPELF